jgi:membrane protease YdiL (CAAX protease family)
MTRIGGVRAPLGLRDARGFALGSAIGLALAVFGTGALAVMAQLSPALAARIANYSENLIALLQPDNTAMIPAVLVVVAVIPGICEEWLFRGVIRDMLMAWSRALRVFAVGLLFALIHVEPVVLLPLFYIGCVLTLLAERTSGWAIPAVAHFTLNAVNGIVTPRVLGDTMPSLWVGALCVCLGAGAAAALVGRFAFPPPPAEPESALATASSLPSAPP